MAVVWVNNAYLLGWLHCRMQLQLRLVLHEGHHEGHLGQGYFHGDQHHEGRPFDQAPLEGQVQILEPLFTIDFRKDYHKANRIDDSDRNEAVCWRGERVYI